MSENITTNLNEDLEKRLNTLYALDKAYVESNEKLQDFLRSEAKIAITRITKPCIGCGCNKYALKSTSICDTLRYTAEVACYNCGIYFMIIISTELLNYALSKRVNEDKEQ